MDQPASKGDLDKLLQSIDTSKIQWYEAFMQAIILEGISHHNLTFETLNLSLFEFNKEIYDAVCEKAIAYFDDFAPARIKSSEIWTCPGNDVIPLLFNQPLRLPLTHQDAPSLIHCYFGWCSRRWFRSRKVGKTQTDPQYYLCTLWRSLVF